MLDEVAYLNIEGSKPDTDVVRALPSKLISTKGPSFLGGLKVTNANYHFLGVLQSQQAEIFCWRPKELHTRY